MLETTLSELRSRAGFYLHLVEEGEVVRVLRDGVAIAEIRPVSRSIQSIGSGKRRVPQPIALSGRLISDVILEDRGQR